MYRILNLGYMRNPRNCGGDTRRHRLAAVEDLDVNTLGRDAEGRQGRFHVGHEASRSAEVDVRLWWNAGLAENRSRKVTRTVEMLTQFVERAGPAVANEAAAAREGEHQLANFSDNGMMLSIPSCMQPEDLPRRPNRGQSG